MTRPAAFDAVLRLGIGTVIDPFIPADRWVSADDAYKIADRVIPPLQLVLGEGPGMTVHVVATSRTLADRVPDLGHARADEEFQPTLSQAARLGANI